MAKGNDKKVVKQAHAVLVSAISNLLVSHREAPSETGGRRSLVPTSAMATA